MRDPADAGRSDEFWAPLASSFAFIDETCFSVDDVDMKWLEELLEYVGTSGYDWGGWY